MDIVIIGVGPAGIQAAIHAARGKASVTMIGKRANSAMYAAHVENYFGVAGKTRGSKLLKAGISQAISFGAEHIEENVIAVERSRDTFTVTTESGKIIVATALILASGISRVGLNIPGEKEFFGKGVSYCATCDCNFFKGKKVAVIGDEAEAAGAAELMTAYASKVYWITKDTDVSDVMIEKAKAAGAEIINRKPSAITGDAKVSGLAFKDGPLIEVDGVFIELGARSSSNLAMDLDIMPNTDGTLRVDEICRTSAAGVFACGDVAGKPWQIAKAVGQGAIAGMNAATYVKGVRDVR